MRQFFTTLLFFGFSMALLAQNQTLTINFSNIKKAKGNLMIALQNSDSSVARGFVVAIKNTGELSYQIEDLPPGKYAIKVFQDVNADNELNTNMLGIPNEPYGFSNNYSPMFGPPDFDDLKFSFPEKKVIAIKLQ